MSKIFIIILWLVILIGGIGFKWFDNTAHPVYWKAVKMFPVNHQLTPNDLTASNESPYYNVLLPNRQDFTGRYLLKEKKQGAPILQEELSISPIMPVIGKDSGVVMLHLSSEEIDLVKLIDAGSLVWLYDTEKKEETKPTKPICVPMRKKLFAKPLIVNAIHRTTEVDSANWILLTIPLLATDTISRFIAAQKRFIVLAR